jgi:hypothetical protein
MSKQRVRSMTSLFVFEILDVQSRGRIQSGTGMNEWMTSARPILLTHVRAEASKVVATGRNVGELTE